LAVLWWFRTVNTELSKHEDVKREYEAMEKKLTSLEREYKALTGTDVRGTLTAKEVRAALEPVFKKRGLSLPPIEHKK
jgi:RecB family endonuclease NucS